MNNKKLYLAEIKLKEARLWAKKMEIEKDKVEIKMLKECCKKSAKKEENEIPIDEKDYPKK